MWHDSVCNTVQEPTVTSTIVVILEVWPESHWPGFALRSRRIIVLCGRIVSVIRVPAKNCPCGSDFPKRGLRPAGEGGQLPDILGTGIGGQAVICPKTEAAGVPEDRQVPVQDALEMVGRIGVSGDRLPGALNSFIRSLDQLSFGRPRNPVALPEWLRGHAGEPAGACPAKSTYREPGRQRTPLLPVPRWSGIRGGSRHGSLRRRKAT